MSGSIGLKLKWRKFSFYLLGFGSAVRAVKLPCLVLQLVVKSKDNNQQNNKQKQQPPGITQSSTSHRKNEMVGRFHLTGEL